MQKVQAQLGFCSGNTGDPIFKETFGNGSNFGDFPSNSKSSYRNRYGEPQNGFCAISPSSFGWFKWFNIPDHTPNDSNGRMLIVNAGQSPGEFFTIAVSGLCENTSYEFSSWLINLLPSSYTDCGYGRSPKPINVSFEIWDSTNSTKLKSGNTGNIYSSPRPNWKQYALQFQTKPGQTSVILKLRNNGVGGCGNDLALDDIIFKPCGDTVLIKNAKGSQNISIPKNELPFSTTLSASPDFSVFSNHFYQWQQSTDGENWTDIAGETNKSYKIKPVSTISYYRVRVAEDPINLSNTSCNSNSEAFKVSIIEPKIPIKKAKVIQKPKSKPKPIVEVKKAIQKKETKVEKVVIQKKEQIKAPVPIVKKLPIKVEVIDRARLAKTYKNVIIVKDGFKIVKDKVWVNCLLGKFVQTSEEITKQGDPNGMTVVHEILYYKAKYGYNSISRQYTIKTKNE